jgi:hypothetical protein
MAWDCGAGHYFDCFLRRRHALNIFPFPVTTAKLICEFYNNRRSAVNQCPRFAYSLCSLCCTNTIGAAIRSPLIGEAQQIKKNPRKLLIGAANSPRFAYWRSEGAPLRL